MIAAYLRSSSIGRLEMCEHAYFIEYNLGIKFPAGIAAEKGSVVHKVLEVLSLAKLSIQKGQDVFTDEHFGEMGVKVCIDDILDLAYNAEKARSTHKWRPADYRDCRKWLYDTLAFNNGMFNPLQMEIFAAEQQFDIEVKEPWGTYSYDLGNGEKLEGQLHLKGTIDLIIINPNGVLEIVDWKTGKRWDWAKDKVKDYKALKEDNQLRLYHYVATELYKETHEHVFVTIFWSKDGGPFSLMFDKDTIGDTKEKLRRFFENINEIDRPRLTKTWKCTKFCPYGMRKFEGSNETICKDIEQSIYQIGMTPTLTTYGKLKSFQTYGDGGGRSAEENQERKVV